MLYNDVRPKSVEKLYGAHLDTIKNDIKNCNLSHSYLFYGKRGTGKTSTGKLIAESLPNCKLVDINASADSTKKDAEKILANANVLPLGFKNKVILIDEIHKASAGFQNAILKPLEDPAPGIHYILCTTEVNKVISTIKSRCKKIEFKALGYAEIKEVLKDGREKCLIKASLPETVLKLIYKKSEGCARDALTELEVIADTDVEAVMLDRLQVVKPESLPKVTNLFWNMYNGEERGEAVKLLNAVNQDNVEGIRKTILSIAFSELKKTNKDEDVDYIHTIIRLFNRKGTWIGFEDLVEVVLDFHMVEKKKLEDKYD